MNDPVGKKSDLVLTVEFTNGAFTRNTDLLPGRTVRDDEVTTNSVYILWSI